MGHLSRILWSPTYLLGIGATLLSTTAPSYRNRSAVAWLRMIRGAAWEHPRESWDHLGAPWRHPGDSWAISRSPWGTLAASSGHRGTIIRLLGLPVDISESSSKHLELSLRYLRATLLSTTAPAHRIRGAAARSGAISEASWQPPGASRDHVGTPRRHPENILEPSCFPWGRLGMTLKAS